MLGHIILLVSLTSAVEVTVYNQDLGLVREVRPLSLKSGVQELPVTDVAARIDATSVHFKSLTAPGEVTVLEQNFRYDLLNQDKLLQRYLDREIELERYTGLAGDKREVIRGTLLSASGGRIMKVDGKILVNPPGNPILPELPEGLLTKPTLVWKLDAKKGGKHDCELSYMTSGMSWRADYVTVVNDAEDQMDLTAWVTVNNNSGATYKDAKLKLIAGDVHRAPQGPRAVRGMMMKAMAAEADAGGFAERSFSEYHLYALGRATTLRDNETKQVELSQAPGVPVRKEYTYDGANVGLQPYNEWTRTNSDYGVDSNKKVSVTLEFKNSKASGLGMALPAGRVRVYKKDVDGSLALIGEDAIDHTPKDETLRVKLGEAFDLVGERKRLDFRVDHKGRWAEERFEIKLRNHKDQPVVIKVVENLYRWSGWKILESSQKYAKKDADTIEFSAQVPKDGETVVTYAVRYSW